MRKKSSKATKSAPVGRPTKYKPEYCKMLIEHMSKGYSYESFSGVVSVCKDTLYEWEKHAEFSYSKKIAFEQCRLWWEKKGMEGLFTGNGEKFQQTLYIFNMKNRFPDEWREKSETKHSVTVSPHQALVDLIEQKKLEGKREN